MCCSTSLNRCTRDAKSRAGLLAPRSMSQPPVTRALESTAAAAMLLFFIGPWKWTTQPISGSRPALSHYSQHAVRHLVLRSPGIHRRDRPALGMRRLPRRLREGAERRGDSVVKGLAHRLHAVVRRGADCRTIQTFERGEAEENGEIGHQAVRCETVRVANILFVKAVPRNL